MKAAVSAVRRVPTSDLGILLIARALVFLSALGTVTMVYLVGRRLFGEWTGRLAAILLAVSPGFVIYGHYFKTDLPMAFWVLVAVILACKVMESGGLACVALLGVVVGYAASTKYPAAVLVPWGFALIVAARAIPGKIRALAGFTVGAAVGFLFGTPYAALNPREFISALRLDADLHGPKNVNLIAVPPAWIDYPLHVLPLALTVPMLLIAAAGLGWALFRKGGALLVVWLVPAAFAVLLELDPAHTVRYALPLLPFAALSAAYLFAEVRRVRVLRAAATFGAAALAIYAFIFSASYVQAMAKPDPRIQAAGWIAQHIPMTETLFTSETHYLNRPQVDRLGYALVDVGYDAGALERAGARHYILSEYTSLIFGRSRWRASERRAFLAYLRRDYAPEACFENSQVLFGIRSKPGNPVPEDWLQPNPRICVLVRKGLH